VWFLKTKNGGNYQWPKRINKKTSILKTKRPTNNHLNLEKYA
jgi:hypothetical protein